MSRSQEIALKLLAVLLLAGLGLSVYFVLPSPPTASVTPLARVTLAPNKSFGGWTLTDQSHPIDGPKLVAVRIFTFDEKISSIRLIVECAKASQTFLVRIASYSTRRENGEFPRKPFITSQFSDFGSTRIGPVGRVTFAASLAMPIFPKFYISEYANELAWDPIVTSYYVASPRRAPSEASGGYDSPARFFASLLPINLEVKNGSGTLQVNIPKGNTAIGTVLEACMARS